MTSFDKVEQDLRGNALRIVCQLPDGKTKSVGCNIGHDVAYVKGLLVRELGDKVYGDIQLHLSGKLMFDPLSLNDFPEIVQECSKCTSKDEVSSINVVVKYAATTS